MPSNAAEDVSAGCLRANAYRDVAVTFTPVLAVQEKPLCSPTRVGGASLPPGMQRPRQSYKFAGVQEVRVQQDACVVMVQRLKGVVR